MPEVRSFSDDIMVTVQTGVKEALRKQAMGRQGIGHMGSGLYREIDHFTCGMVKAQGDSAMDGRIRSLMAWMPLAPTRTVFDNFSHYVSEIRFRDQP